MQRRIVPLALFALLAFALFAGCATCQEAQEIELPEVQPLAIDVGDHVVAFHGGARFTIEPKEAGAGPKVETRGDPLLFVDGVQVGHWPATIVRYVLDDEREMICFATGAQGDTETVWIYEGGRRTVIVFDVNTGRPEVRRKGPAWAEVARLDELLRTMPLHEVVDLRKRE